MLAALALIWACRAEPAKPRHKTKRVSIRSLTTRDLDMVFLQQFGKFSLGRKSKLRGANCKALQWILLRITLVPDGRLSRLGNAVLVKSIPEQRRNLGSFFSFDLVPLEQEQELAVPKQSDRRRGWTITLEVASGPFGRFDIRSRKNGNHILWADFILKRKRHAGSRAPCSTAANGIDYDHKRTRRSGHRCIDLLWSSGLSYSEVGQVLSHRFD